MKKIRIVLDTKSQLDNFMKICTKQNFDSYLTDGTNQFRVNAKSILGCIIAKMQWNEVYCEYDEKLYGNQLEHLLHQNKLIY